MYVLRALLLTLVLTASVHSQSYTIRTLAGGALPVDIPGTSANLGAVSALATDAAGNVLIALHGAARLVGGTQVFGYDAVVRWDAATGMLTSVAGNGTRGYGGDHGPATSARLNAPTGVAIDSAGNIYIADSGNFRIRKVANGLITTVAGNGRQGYGCRAGPAGTLALGALGGIAVDAAGDIYFASDGNCVGRISNGIITTAAGNGEQGYGGDSGPAADAQLSWASPYGQQPGGLAVDNAGNLYIADTGNNRIRKVSNGVITTVAGNGEPGESGDDGPALDAQLNAPTSITVDAASNLYIAARSHIRIVSDGVIKTISDLATGSISDSARRVVAADAAGHLYAATPMRLYIGICAGDPCAYLSGVDNYNYRVLKISPGTTETIAGNGPPRGEDGPASTAQLDGPAGVATDPANDLYIADMYHRRVRKIANGTITTVAGGGSAPTEGALATSVEIAGVGSIAADGAGNIYIADIKNIRVLKVSEGRITTMAGGGKANPGDGGLGTDAVLGYPQGLGVDTAGNLYIADSVNNRIRKLSPDGRIATVAGNGTAGYSGDDGPAISAQLNYPAAVAADPGGNLYIADLGNNCIRKITDGVITTVAGTGTQGFSGDDGPATSAQLAHPGSVAVDAAGDLYIADTGNNRVRKVSKGPITTIAGDGTYGFDGDGGPATSAQLNLPSDVAVDSAGNVYIADFNNHRVRVLIPSATERISTEARPRFGRASGR